MKVILGSSRIRPVSAAILKPCFGFLVLVAFLPNPAPAQTTVFSPVISLEQVHTSNTNFAPEGEEVADSHSAVSLLLPVERRLRNGVFSFSYNGVYQVYDNFDSLDNPAHTLSLALTTRPTEKSRFDIFTTASRSLDQGDPSSVLEPDLFLSRRVQRDIVLFELGYHRQTRGRWEWGVGTDFQGYQFEEIEGFSAGQAPAPIEDRYAYGVSAELLRSTSRRTAFGLSYKVSQFDLETLGDETVNSVSVVVRRELQDRSSLRLTAGFFRATGKVIEGETGGRADADEGLDIGLDITRQYRRSALEIKGQRAVSVGGDLPGTATVSFLQVGLRSLRSRSVDWGLSARYAEREPVAEALPTEDSTGLQVELAARLGKKLRLRVHGSYMLQSTSNTDSDVKALTAGLGLVYQPRGRGPA